MKSVFSDDGIYAVFGIAANMVLLISLTLVVQSPGQSAYLVSSPGTMLAQSADVLALGETPGLTSTEYVFLPLISQQPKPMPWIDPSDRQMSLNYFKQVYRASEGVDIGWTGDHANCDAGEMSTAFQVAVRLRINYFRAMAGMPGTLQLSDEYSSKAQPAALMMSVNGQLSHNPPPSWLCYTNEGAEEALSAIP